MDLALQIIPKRKFFSIRTQTSALLIENPKQKFQKLSSPFEENPGISYSHRGRIDHFRQRRRD